MQQEQTKNPRGPPFQCCRRGAVSVREGQMSGRISTLTLGVRGLGACHVRLMRPSCSTPRRRPAADGRRIQVFFREGWQQVPRVCAYVARHGRAGPGWAACCKSICILCTARTGSAVCVGRLIRREIPLRVPCHSARSVPVQCPLQCPLKNVWLFDSAR